MMKSHNTVTLALAGLLGIPALASQQDGSMASLEQALASTKNAIAELVGLREQLTKKDPEALERIKELTEAPIANSADTADHIMSLQRDIDALNSRLTVSVAGTSPLSLANPLAAQPQNTQQRDASQSTPQAGPTTIIGLKRSPNVEAFEEEGYSTDDLRRAKLLVRAGRSTEALPVLERMIDTVEGRYWLARAQQGAGKEDLAYEAFKVIEADKEAGEFAAWAKDDRAMIELQRKLRPAGTTGENK
ncbi:MAG: hypothetical protein ACI8QC_000818 [Planctomycetota bacterium]|jgi:hypothetical protein